MGATVVGAGTMMDPVDPENERGTIRGEMCDCGGRPIGPDREERDEA